MPATLEEHAGDIGWSLTRAANRLDELIQLRLIRRGPDGILRAEDPRASLGRLIDSEEASLDVRRRQLLDLRSSIASFETDYRRGLQVSGPRLPPWEDVAPSEVAEVIEYLARNSRGPVLRVGADVEFHVRAVSGLLQLAPAELMESREQRAVLSLAVLNDPQWREVAGARVVAGEHQRYTDLVPVSFVVYGRAGVLLSQGAQPEVGALLIRPAVMIDAFSALFETLWHRAEGVHQGSAASQDVKMLELLALGFKDEAIARHLGLGLRTVRRRVSRLMEEHDVETRFQLGLAVARRGVLGSGERSIG